ncbi:sensor domain-containing protein [Nonomuraea sp. B10E15]|uniref:sensor histidine kinase n=1 Tax=Nonomuraea sp. B10E15 TaxID=3153560 RepID=UPI00325E4105
MFVQRLRADARRRTASAGHLALGLAAGVAALSLTALVLAGLVALPVAGLGLPVLAEGLALVRVLAGLQRERAARVLGAAHGDPLPTVRPPYGGGLVRRLGARLRDPRTRRELRWLLAFGPLAIATALPPAGLLLAAAAVISKPKDLPGKVAEAFVAALLLLTAWLLLPWLSRLQAKATWHLLMPSDRAELAARVAQLTASRTTAVDVQAAELRRIERDLHDGAQARLVALTMSLGLAEHSIAGDPEHARRLVVEARESATTALAELRDLVRGVHPPVLADRGLPGALEAAAMLCPVPVRTHLGVAGRPSPPVESAMYFAAVETLANIAKHSCAGRAWMRLTYEEGVLRLVVGDDGAGGARPRHGSGLAGIRERLSVFDGALAVRSPAGGPTEIIMEVPCALSSPKTTLCSETG